MATFRKVHTSFWSDPFVQELTPEQKYFYLYLMTNENTRQCGIYEVTKRKIAFDTGYNIDTVSKLLEYFIGKGKIYYSGDTNEVALKNWVKYNTSVSPKVETLIQQELQTVKDTLLIQYLYSMDTESLKEEEENKNKNKKENKWAKQVRQLFKPPERIELINYLTDEKNFDDFTAMAFADTFMNFYESKNWYVGKNKMHKWKAAVNTWISKNNQNGKLNPNSTGNRKITADEARERFING